jgi:AcrR family transcriptional regulator
MSDPTPENIPAQEAHPALRLKVLESAFAAFNYAGFHAVSTDDLAKTLHISKKTLYKIFRSKEEILDGAVTLQFADLEKKLHQGILANPIPRDAIWFIAREYVSINSLLSPLLIAEISADLPYVYERLMRFQREHFHKTFVRLLKAYREEDLLEYPSPTKALAAAFFRALDGQKETLPETLKFFCHAFVKGMTVRDREKKKK